MVARGQFSKATGYLSLFASMLNSRQIRKVKEGKMIKTEDPLRITPVLAEKVLKLNSDNRRANRRYAGGIAADIKKGEFELTATDLVIGTDGIVHDGQHRLMACVESKKSIVMFVCFNSTTQARKYIDGGLPRNLVARAHLGADIRWLNNKHQSVFNGLRTAGCTRPTEKMRMSELEPMIEKWGDQVREVVSLLNRGAKSAGICIQPVLVTVFRAWVQPVASHGRIAEFCNILISGMPMSQRDTAAVMLRNFLLSALRAKNPPTDAQKYARTQGALVAFLKGRAPKQLRDLSNEQFLLPGEKPQKIAGARNVRARDKRKN